MFNFAQPIEIGNLSVPNRVFLAPLAGVSDIPMRRICQQLGAGLTYVEMLSATAVRYKNKRTFEMMARHKEESILGVQVTGPTADEVAEAVSLISTLSSSGFETFDINMGCPVKKVVGAGCGSAFLKDPARVSKTVSQSKTSLQNLDNAVKCASGSLSNKVPLSSKIRLGYTREDVNVEDIASHVVSSGANMLTIHGRTRSESYDTPVDFNGIRRGCEAARKIAALQGLKVPVLVGNGDVFDFESAQAMIQQTGVDAVMVSRGALGNPWIFSEILSGEKKNPTLGEWLDVVMEHLCLHEAHYGKTKGSAALARKHLLWYSKGFAHMRALREKFNSVEDLDDARTILQDFVSQHSKSTKRFEGLISEKNYDPKYEMDRELDRGVGHLDSADS